MLILRLLAILSLFLYTVAPKYYSLAFSQICFMVFMISSIVMLNNNCKQTLIKFEFFFLVAFFLTNISFSVFTYPINPDFSLFSLGYNEIYLNKGLALSVVGICFFNCGVFEKNKLLFCKSVLPKTTIVKPRLAFYVLYLAFIPELITIYRSGEYSTAFESSLINVILVYVIYFFIFAFFYSYRNETKKVTIIKHAISPIPILILLYVLLFLLIGSRTIPMRVVLGTLFFYGIFIDCPKKIWVLIGILLGAFVLFVVGIVRGGGDGLSANSIQSILEIGNELTINNRSLYVLMEYADVHGINLGSTMLLSVLSVVPFAQSLFLWLTEISASSLNSANLVTDLYYSSVTYTGNRIGLGTNLIGDIYVSFGLFGVIILMYMLGYLTRNFYCKACGGNIVAILMYATIFMDAIYFPRSCYLTPIRTMIWTYVIFWFYNRKNACLFTNIK